MNKTSKIRLWIQIAFFALSALIFYFLALGKANSAHQFCPYAIVCFGFTNMGFIKITQALFASAIILGFGIAILSMFLGRKFCGYVCPLGTLQEGIYRFHKKRCFNRNPFPFYLETKLGKLKYIVLIVTIIMAVFKLSSWYMNYCPVMAFSRIPMLGLRGLIVIVLILLGGFFVERIWCRFFCPYGALLNIFQYIGGIFGIKRSQIIRNLEKCNECGVCAGYCPMNINILEEETIKDENCIHCSMCANACPKKGLIFTKR